MTAAAVARRQIRTGVCGKGRDYASLVNPFIGTGGHGHTFPGAVVPHGMIQPSPDTRIDGWDACSGYYIADTLINGFSHTHVSGTGCADYGDVLMMPTVGNQAVEGQVDTLRTCPTPHPSPTRPKSQSRDTTPLRSTVTESAPR